ncbi:MAG TPA: phosphoadenylyl-sulfate reductase [Planctomycetota bacterium]|nr:phosphoadenylyl-sulfate reductase [Planctomycetota bacterium]
MGAEATLLRSAVVPGSLDSITAETLVRRAVQEFGAGLTFACSFGAEDMVIMDMLLAADRNASVFVLDTGRLHQETHDLIAKAASRWDRQFTFFVPEAGALEALLAAQGTNGFYDSVEARKACCRVRKVEPLARALAGKTAWLTGLRRGQSVTRTELAVAEVDAAHGGIVKLNPLAEWSEVRVWDYIRERGLPYSTLHDRGFPSVGCAPCTRAVRRIEELRSGRWWWEEPEHKECGLHGRAPNYTI